MYREEAAAARSTATPSVNGTGPSSSVLPSRVVTPNGVRTPDWILDCEVCHKQGVNVVSAIRSTAISKIQTARRTMDCPWSLVAPATVGNTLRAMT